MNTANILLTVILSFVALITVMARVIKWVLHQWAVEEGLIRPQRKGQPVANWPNGWHSLPDTLEGIHNEMRSHHPKR